MLSRRSSGGSPTPSTGIAPAAPAAPDLAAADAFVWHAETGALEPVERGQPRRRSTCSRASTGERDILLDNTQRFARGLPANNALLWGARGMGKSSLVKAVHAAVNDGGPAGAARGSP